MSKQTFEGAYLVAYEYVSGDRPQHFRVEAQDIEECEDRTELKKVFYEMMQEDFEQNIFPYATNFDQFLVWVQEIRKEDK